MERRLCIDGCFGTPLLTTSAILAGSKWSCMILKAVMLQPMDGLQARFPTAHLKLYVGDLKLTLMGRRAELLEQAPKVVGGAIEAIEGVKLQVSRGTSGRPGGKSKQLAATPWLRERLREPMAAMGMAACDAGAYLGVDFVLGRTGRRPKASARDRMLV